MERFGQFARNAGTIGTIQSLAVLVILILFLRRDAVTGNWIITLPMVLATLLFAFLIRDFLVDNFDGIRWVMNGLVVVGIVLVLSGFGQAKHEAVWERSAIAGCIGLYMGCYFWMLSDSRIQRLP